ncbi:hypothetical protein [Candidatus Halobonum tyrrellensis]|uniref:hypothetical protein n=1 Tax=Candidatus Halobonum tyrrellensis TaxID=1431545 RepID=UPI00126855F2|nr:hypothetical protein [Candidatus Halobonum tyrrellensis]
MIVEALVEWVSQFFHLTTNNPGSTIALLSLLAGGVWYRLSNLSSPEDRERFLHHRFDDRAWKREPLVAEFDTLHVVEAQGYLYKLRRFLFGHLDGRAVLVLDTNFKVPDEVWELEEFVDIYRDELPCHVEIQSSKQISPSRVQLALEIHSLDPDVIQLVVSELLNFLHHVDKTGDPNSLQLRSIVLA